MNLDKETRAGKVSMRKKQLYFLLPVTFSLALQGYLSEEDWGVGAALGPPLPAWRLINH